MFEQALHLRLAVHVFAAENDFTVDVGEGLAAFGALCGGNDRLGPNGAKFLLDVGDFWDDFATLLNAHRISVVQVQTGHLVEVVEGGALDGGTCEAHGCKVCYRRYRTGAAYLEFYGKKRRIGSFGLELIGDSPPGALACGA